MSPEQAERARGRSPRATSSRSASCFYECLTMRRLFRGEATSRRVRAIREDAIVPPSVHHVGIPPDAYAVVMRMLARDPRDRYQTCDADPGGARAHRAAAARPCADAARVRRQARGAGERHRRDGADAEEPATAVAACEPFSSEATVVARRWSRPMRGPSRRGRWRSGFWRPGRRVPSAAPLVAAAASGSPRRSGGGRRRPRGRGRARARVGGAARDASHAAARRQLSAATGAPPVADIGRAQSPSAPSTPPALPSPSPPSIVAPPSPSLRSSHKPPHHRAHSRRRPRRRHPPLALSAPSAPLRQAHRVQRRPHDARRQMRNRVHHVLAVRRAPPVVHEFVAPAERETAPARPITTSRARSRRARTGRASASAETTVPIVAA